MTNINRIKELAGVPLMESEFSSNTKINWNIENEGMYLTGTWNGTSGPIEFLADGFEYGDGFWKIYINEAGFGDEEIRPLDKEDLKSIIIAMKDWFGYAKNVDFKNDNILPVRSVQVNMPTVRGISMRNFALEVSRITGLQMLGIDGDQNEIKIDFRNTPIPYADEYKKQQLDKEENPYKTDTM